MRECATYPVRQGPCPRYGCCKVQTVRGSQPRPSVPYPRCIRRIAKPVAQDRMKRHSHRGGFLPGVPRYRTFKSRGCLCNVCRISGTLRTKAVNSTYFGLLAEFGEANIPLDRVAPKYFGLICAEARRRAPAKQLPCRAFRLGGQKSPWLVSATDLAELIDVRRQKAGGDLRGRAGRAPVFAGVMSRRFSGFRFV